MSVELLDRFEAEYLAPNSISLPRRTEQVRLLKRVAATLDHPLEELTKAEVDTYIGQQLADGTHPNTGRKYVGMIRSFAAWGGEAGVLLNAAELRTLKNPRGSTSQGRPRPYTPAQIAQLRADVAETWPALPVRGKGSRAIEAFVQGKGHLGLHLRRHARRLQMEAQIALALECGLRREEIICCPIDALHPDNSQLVVVNGKQLPGQNIKRAIPYPMHARKVVGEWLELRWLMNPPHNSAWLSLVSTRVAAQQLRPESVQDMARMLRYTGQWEWHRLRHTAATEWLRADVPLEKVKVFMGHSNITQTLAYAEIVNSDVDKAFNAAEAAFNRRMGIAA